MSHLFYTHLLPTSLLVAACLFLSACPAPAPEEAPIAVFFSQVGQDVPEAEHLDQRFCAFLDATTQSIDLASFDIDLPCVETSLKALHQRGVQVRIVTDSDHITPVIKALKKAKIPVVEDNRSAFMHNKFAVRDARTVWSGSFNFTENDARKNNNNAQIIHSQELATNYSQEFAEMFNDKAFGPTSPANTPHPQVTVGNTLIENYFSPEDDLPPKLRALLEKAEQDIHFLAFSFTDDELGKVLLAKAKAGVKVSGVFEKTGASSASSQYGRLKKAKLDVKRDGNNRLLHHKVFIIDGKIVATGSYNFSRNAARSNDENMLFIHNPEVATQYLEEYERIAAAGS